VIYSLRFNLSQEEASSPPSNLRRCAPKERLRQQTLSGRRNLAYWYCGSPTIRL